MSVFCDKVAFLPVESPLFLSLQVGYELRLTLSPYDIIQRQIIACLGLLSQVS